MIVLSVFCRSCGEHIEEEVDEQFPPSSIHCACGARYRLKIEGEDAHDMDDLNAGAEEEAEVSNAELSGAETAEQTGSRCE